MSFVFAAPFSSGRNANSSKTQWETKRLSSSDKHSGLKQQGLMSRVPPLQWGAPMNPSYSVLSPGEFTSERSHILDLVSKKKQTLRQGFSYIVYLGNDCREHSTGMKKWDMEWGKKQDERMNVLPLWATGNKSRWGPLRDCVTHTSALSHWGARVGHSRYLSISFIPY